MSLPFADVNVPNSSPFFPSPLSLSSYCRADQLASLLGIRISIDRGGTFADVFCDWRVEGEETRREKVFKLLSVDTNNYEDAPTEGVRRVLEHVLGVSIPRGQKLDTSKIEYIR